MSLQSQRPKTSMHPSLQFLVLVALTIGLVVAGTVIGAVLIIAVYGLDTLMKVMQLDLSQPHTADALWILQIAGTTLPLLITPFIFGKLMLKEPEAYLKLNSRFSWTVMVIVFAVMLISTPMMEWMISVNQKMQLPTFLKGLEDWMRQSEQSAQRAIQVLLNMPTVFDLLKSLLLVALITAVAEELLFRGNMQTIFLRWTKNHHAAIWITAALFSAFHMEFYGFVPRMFLGVLFGYFTFWSGSIWPAVWGHFLNNGSAVLLTYLYQHGQLHDNPDNAQSFSWLLRILSVILTLALLWVCRTAALNPNEPLTDDGEKLG